MKCGRVSKPSVCESTSHLLTSFFFFSETLSSEGEASETYAGDTQRNTESIPSHVSESLNLKETRHRSPSRNSYPSPQEEADDLTPRATTPQKPSPLHRENTLAFRVFGASTDSDISEPPSTLGSPSRQPSRPPSRSPSTVLSAVLPSSFGRHALPESKSNGKNPTPSVSSKRKFEGLGKDKELKRQKGIESSSSKRVDSAAPEESSHSKQGKADSERSQELVLSQEYSFEAVPKPQALPRTTYSTNRKSGKARAKASPVLEEEEDLVSSEGDATLGVVPQPVPAPKVILSDPDSLPPKRGRGRPLGSTKKKGGATKKKQADGEVPTSTSSKTSVAIAFTSSRSRTTRSTLTAKAVPSKVSDRKMLCSYALFLARGCWLSPLT